MSRATHLYSEEYELPKLVKTRDGIEFNPYEDGWIFIDCSKEHRIDFSIIERYATREIARISKFVLIEYIRKSSVPHVQNIYARFCAFLNHTFVGKQIDLICTQDILAYKSTLNRRREWYLLLLRSFFNTWVGLGFPLVESSLVEILNKMRIKGNIQGEAVRTADPDRGPLSDFEFEGISCEANDRFASGEIDFEQYLLVWLFLATGVRSVQLALLKFGDFRGIIREANGRDVYRLEIPRAKQSGKSPRSEFKSYEIIAEVGRIIENYKWKQERVAKLLNIDINDLAFFSDENSRIMVPGLQYHKTGQQLASQLKEVLDKFHIVNLKSGKKTRIASYRFRYTVGTRCARETGSEYVVADTLDHSTIGTALTYVKAVPDIIERIDKAMAIHLAPLAQAFVGTLIQSEEEALRAGDPNSKINSPQFSNSTLGNCGSYGVCHAVAPIACYTCRNFQPWIDGPHDLILDSLLSDRQRVLDNTGDHLIAAINDRLILACAEVVRLCSNAKKEQGEWSKQLV